MKLESKLGTFAISIGLLAGLLQVVGVLPLYAAMTDTAALRKARTLWGPWGAIASIKRNNATTQIKQVGILSPGCATEFMVFGQALSDFSDAFADMETHPPRIAGPFNGTVILEASAWDNVAVAGWQWILDGQDWGSELLSGIPPGQVLQQMNFSTPYDMRQLADGYHVLCARVRDTSGNVARSAAALFRVDKSITQAASVSWRPNTMASDAVDAIPLVSAEMRRVE